MSGCSTRRTCFRSSIVCSSSSSASFHLERSLYVVAKVTRGRECLWILFAEDSFLRFHRPQSKCFGLWEPTLCMVSQSQQLLAYLSAPRQVRLSVNTSPPERKPLPRQIDHRYNSTMHSSILSILLTSSFAMRLDSKTRRAWGRYVFHVALSLSIFMVRKPPFPIAQRPCQSTQQALLYFESSFES